MEWGAAIRLPPRRQGIVQKGRGFFDNEEWGDLYNEEWGFSMSNGVGGFRYPCDTLIMYVTHWALVALGPRCTGPPQQLERAH